SYDACSEDVAAQNAAENVDEDGAHAAITHQNAKRILDLLGRGAAADVQKVSRRAPGILDDVHRSHSETGAVHHASHAAVELDVIQSILRGFHLERIFLIDVAQFAQVGMAKQGVIVERHLRVERPQFAVAGEHARIT